MLALSMGRPGIAGQLLRRAALDPSAGWLLSAPDHRGETVLHWLVRMRSADGVLQALRYRPAGTPVERNLQGRTPMHIACATGQPVLVFVLALAFGSQVLELPDAYGLLPMDLAAGKGDAATCIACVLVSQGGET